MMYLEEIKRFKQKWRYLCIKLLVQLLENGVPGHPGHLAMLIVVVELRQEEESAIDHSHLMEGTIVKVILMKQQYVICSLVLIIHLQLMEDGAFGHPGLLAMLTAEKGQKQEEEIAINHHHLMEELSVLDFQLKQQDVTCITVQLMEDGVPGAHILNATRFVVEEIRREPDSAITQHLLMEGLCVQENPIK